MNALVEAAGILNDMWSVTVGWLQHSGSNSTSRLGCCCWAEIPFLERGEEGRVRGRAEGTIGGVRCVGNVGALGCSGNMARGATDG